MAKQGMKRDSNHAAAKSKKGTTKILSSSSPNSVNKNLDDDHTKKGDVLAFAVLSKEDSDKLLEMNVNDMESKLKEILQLQPETDLKDASVLDYYVAAMFWAKQQHFNSQKFSGFFTLIKNLLEKIRDKRLPLVDCIKEFCKTLVGIETQLSSDLKSGGLEFFKVKEAQLISDYMNNSIFQHYKLYEYMFQSQQTEEIISSDISVEVPLPATAPFPSPLDEGISEDVFKEFLCIPTPSISKEATGDLKEDEELKPLSPMEVELPPETADLFSKLTAEDIRSVIEEVSSQMLRNVQIGVENKIRQQENNVLAKINKIHNVLPETPREEPEDN